MKNLILIHLESLSNNLLYHASEEIFPNLFHIFKKGLFFPNYYSTATSTIMTVADLMYGDVYQLEKAHNLDDVSKQKTIQSMFMMLETKGYSTSAYVYPRFAKENRMDRVNLKKIFGKDTHYEELSETDQLRDKIANTIKSRRAFALYVYDYTSLLSSPFRTEHVDGDFLEVAEEGYRRIDRTVGFVFEALQKENILENTVVVLFGDHGDDLYSHGFANGFTHAIEPYASVIRTPLAIYANGVRPGIISNLVNTTDLRNMILSLVSESDLESAMSNTTRKYSFSRNLFWNQPCGALNKAYSITDGRYMLMASPKGLELYLCKYDVFGTVNLLNFFQMHKGNIRLRKELDHIDGVHVEYMLKIHADTIIHEFGKLRAELIKNLEYMQNQTGIKLNFRQWFQSIRINEQTQKEIKGAMIQNRIEKKMKGITGWADKFVSLFQSIKIR